MTTRKKQVSLNPDMTNHTHTHAEKWNGMVLTRWAHYNGGEDGERQKNG